MSLILDQVVAISRLQRDSDNPNKEEYELNEALQAVKMEIQPASPEQTAMANGVYGQTYLAFTTYSGVMVGDKVTVSGTGETYRVRGKENWELPDLSPHYELTLVMMEDEEI